MEKSVELLDVMAQIRSSYDSMSKSQQKVAAFFLTRALEAVYLPAARIAEQLHVSHSTVVRAAQAIGFTGFPEFQEALQEQFLGQINAATIFQLGSRKLMSELGEQSEEITPALVLQRVMLTDARNIESLTENISMPDFERAIELLSTAPSVYVVGLRASAPLALNFGSGLRQVRPNCFLLRPDFGDLVDQIASLGEGDVLFSICVERYMRETLQCMDYARKMNATVITITDSPLSPAARRADLVFVVRFGVWFYGSSTALFSLLNALMIAVLLRQDERAQERLDVVDRIIDQFQLFAPNESRRGV